MGKDKVRFWAVWLLRVVLGSTFMLSGAVKAIDVYGFIYKLEEYAEVWDVAISFPLLLTAAAFLITFEFVCGLLLFVGAYRRMVVYALSVFMSVMLCLTLYIWIADPVSDCGCFGDFIILSNSATFWKNVVICILMALLWSNNAKVKGFYHPNFQWGALVLGTVYLLSILLYGYFVQPMIDFRSFKAGTKLVEGDNETDDTEFVFVYERDGVEKSFTVDSLPDDSWTFVDREAVDEREELHDKTDFAPHYSNGEPANDFFDDESKSFLIVAAANPDDINAVLSFYINRLESYLTGSDVELVEMIGASNGDDVDVFKERTMSPAEVLVAEPTVIKEFARGKVAYVYVEGGIVKWKRSAQSLNYDEFKSSPKTYLAKAMTADWHEMLVLSILLVSGLIVLYLFDISRKLFRKRGIKTKI